MGAGVFVSAAEAVDMATLYCPTASDVAGWSLDGDTQQMEGDDLFLLINGGAEIYHEYGFIRVLAASYRNGHGKKLNLEIYEMEDDASAYGAYSFKTAPGGSILEIGDEALLEDYYLNMWNGRFLVTVVGFDSTVDTLDGLKKMARAVSGKLKQKGRKPSIVSLLPTAGLKPGGVTYLEGPLGFYNRYSIDPENILGIREAVIGQYGDAFLLVVHYPNSEQRGIWFSKAINCIGKNSRVTNFVRSKDSSTFTDPWGLTSTIKASGDFIFLANGFPRSMIDMMFESVESKIRQGSH